MSNRQSSIAYHNRTPCSGYPPVFADDEAAILWGIAQGAYKSHHEAQAAFAAMAARYPKPYHWPIWLRLVGRKLQTW